MASRKASSASMSRTSTAVYLCEGSNFSRSSSNLSSSRPVATTPYPCRSSSSVTAEPMKPEAPVTSTVAWGRKREPGRVMFLLHTLWPISLNVAGSMVQLLGRGCNGRERGLSKGIDDEVKRQEHDSMMRPCVCSLSPSSNSCPIPAVAVGRETVPYMAGCADNHRR